MKKLIKLLAPPIFINVLRSFYADKHGWKGNYSSWKDAKNASTGYDSEKILLSVKNSLLRVKSGEVVHERDSVTFDEIQYSWPLLTGLMLAAAKLNDNLKVLDFGGSLGSSYFQNKKFLTAIEKVSWSIVEQEHFVDVGKQEFENSVLKFYYDPKTCISSEEPNVLVLSSVLQYLQYPYDILEGILRHDFEFIIIDRSPFSVSGDDEVKLQIVPTDIYTASMPCWFFDEAYFVAYFESKGYDIIEKFSAIDGKCDECDFKGMILRNTKSIHN